MVFVVMQLICCISW